MFFERSRRLSTCSSSMMSETSELSEDDFQRSDDFGGDISPRSEINQSTDFKEHEVGFKGNIVLFILIRNKKFPSGPWCCCLNTYFVYAYDIWLLLAIKSLID